MPSFLKKSSEKAKIQQVPAWHTNFRNYAVLPDTKVVRTSFFVNGLLVLAAISLVLVFAYQEYILSDLRKQSAEWQLQIDKNRVASDRALVLYKKYKAEEQKVGELDTFLKGQQLVFSDFIIGLSRTRPPGIVFVSIDYKESGASIKGYAQGASEQATGAASSYEKQLKEDARINTVFKSILMTNVTRDAQAGKLFFDIVLSFNQAKPK